MAHPSQSSFRLRGRVDLIRSAQQLRSAPGEIVLDLWQAVAI
jgi:hypothetical protein